MMLNLNAYMLLSRQKQTWVLHKAAGIYVLLHEPCSKVWRSVVNTITSTARKRNNKKMNAAVLNAKRLRGKLLQLAAIRESDSWAFYLLTAIMKLQGWIPASWHSQTWAHFRMNINSRIKRKVASTNVKIPPFINYCDTAYFVQQTVQKTTRKKKKNSHIKRPKNPV